MNIPNSERKKALLIIDVQPAFINKRNSYILKNIQKLLKKVPYDLYVEALFHAEKNSIWDKQLHWTCQKGERFYTSPVILGLLQKKNTYSLQKTTRSAFKGDKNLKKMLETHRINEVHI